MRLLLTFLAAALVAATPFRIHSDPDDTIAELDRLIQLRFLDGKDFGMNRLLPRQYHGIRTFAPENLAEQTVVSSLKSAGYEVALFLAGRGVLHSPASPLVYRSGVQGPAYLTPVGPDLPKPESLLDESRRALARVGAGGGYEIERDGWTVALRPLRAANESCIQCHLRQGYADLKQGDPIGAAMYVYRRR